MFRRIISMLLIGSLVIVGNDALASGCKSPRRKTEREKRADYLSQEARSARSVAAQIAQGKKALGKNIALKRQLTVAGVADKELFTSIAGADQAVFTPQDLIALLQNPATAGELRDGAQAAIDIIDAVLARRTWKHFAPVAPVLEVVRQPLVDLQASVAQAITDGHLTADAAVEVYLHPAPAATPLLVPVAGVNEDATNLDFGLPIILEQHANVRPVQGQNPWVSRGTATAAAGTIVCFVVAGVTMPVFVPTMAMNAAIGAGLGASCSIVSSLWKRENLENSAKRVISGAAHGAFSGTIGCGIKAYVPTDFLGSAVTELALEGASLGMIAGAVYGIDDNEILRRAFTGGLTGAALGAAYGSLKELYGYVTSLQAVLTQSQEAVERSQAQVAQLERQLEAAIDQDIVNKETIDQLKVTIDQQNRTNIENFRRLHEANTFNVQQSTTIAGQQVVIEDQKIVARMLNEKIEENAATFERMHRVLQEQDAANKVLADRVVALEQAAARRLADRTALVVSPVDMGMSTQQPMSLRSDAPAVDVKQKTVLDPLYEITGAKALGKCIKAGSGSTECLGLLNAFYQATGAKAAGNWVKSFFV